MTDTVYLNHAGTSWPKPPAVVEACMAALSTDPATWGATFAAQHEAVSKALGIADAARLLLTPSCTAALSLALSDLPWKAGETLITSAWEHHALAGPAERLAARGVRTTIIPPAGEAPFDLEAFDRALGEGAHLVAISAASNVTGALLPVDDVIARAHAAGTAVLIDAAQTAGWLPLPLEADMVTFAGHKGPRAPWGIGGLYVAPTLGMHVPEAGCAIPVEGAPPCAPMPGYCDGGSVNRAALAGLATGLSTAPTANDLERARSLCAAFVDGARDLGLTFHGPVDEARRMPTAAFSADGTTPAALAAALAKQNVIASGGKQCAPLAHRTLGTEEHGVLRVSFGVASTEGDVTRALDALRSALQR